MMLLPSSDAFAMRSVWFQRFKLPGAHVLQLHVQGTEKFPGPRRGSRCLVQVQRPFLHSTAEVLPLGKRTQAEKKSEKRSTDLEVAGSFCISFILVLRIRKCAGGGALLTFEQFCLLMEFLKDNNSVTERSCLSRGFDPEFSVPAHQEQKKKFTAVDQDRRLSRVKLLDFLDFLGSFFRSSEWWWIIF